MKEERTVVAAILAGGTGTRTQAGVPKQFLDMGGKTLIERTVDALASHPAIDRVIVVSHPALIEPMEIIRRNCGHTKWKLTVPGGRERYLSSYEAIKACPEKDGILLIHDAARPFVSHSLIDRLLDAVILSGAAVPVTPLRDTLLHIDGNKVDRAENRENFRLAQTPQAFHIADIRSAFKQVINNTNAYFTDDCGIYLHAFPNRAIQIVEGDETNIKLTYHSDIERFNKIFSEK